MWYEKGRKVKVQEAAKEKPPKKAEKLIKPEPKRRPKHYEILPVRVDRFDELMTDHGLERGSNILLSGGTGTGKTTFCIQSLYYGALAGEKGIYISFEEEPEEIKKHMLKNFKWDLYKMEKKGLMAVLKFDPADIARSVEQVMEQEKGDLMIAVREMQLPFKPDRIALDSISSLAIAFEEEDDYRKYIMELFEMFKEYNSINFIVSETEQDPKKYSRSGIEEFLADGVVVLYNIKVRDKRVNALEILKLRSGKHVKRMIPYAMTGKGIEILPKLVDS